MMIKIDDEDFFFFFEYFFFRKNFPFAPGTFDFDWNDDTPDEAADDTLEDAVDDDTPLLARDENELPTFDDAVDDENDDRDDIPLADDDDDNDNERIKDGIKKKNLPGSDGLMIRSNSKVMMMSITATLIAGSDL